MPRGERTEVAVIGLGAMGSATLYQLAKRGVAALGIDRYAPPHAHGSSHGETRITRQAVGEGRDYIPFVLNSHRIWRELEAETGDELLAACGVLIMGPGSNGGTVRADRAVVSAGGWTAPLLGEPFDQLLQVRRQLLHWYALDDASAYGPRSPTFIYMHGPGDTDYLYGFPPVPGQTSIKVASEQYATSTTADTVDRTVTEAESAAMFNDHVAGRLAGATPRVVGTAACVYTITPDRGFIIDTHPRLDKVTVVSACSGHGFKHSAGIGEAVAQHVAEGGSRVDLAPFTLSRFAEPRRKVAVA